MEFPTGTPMFAGIRVLQSCSHSIATECESLFYCTLYILSGGHLPWMDVEDTKHAAALRLGMLQYFMEDCVLSAVKDL